MQEKDKTQKTLERYNDVFSDILNVLLFNGEKIVDEDSLSDALEESIFKFDDKIHSQERDVAKYWEKSQINLALFGLENQTNPDKLMPLRVFSYDGAEYGKQSRKEHRGKEKYPVITLILYLGYKQRWKYPKSLLEILNVNEKLKPYVNDFKINLFEIAYLDKSKIDSFKSDFKILAEYLYQMRINNDYTPDKITVKHTREVLSLMSVMTGDTRFEEVVSEEEKEKEGVINMCEVLDRIEQRGIEKGIEKGRAEGRAEGLTLGVNILNKLNEILIKNGDFKSLIKANADKDYREELLKKYDLMKDFTL